MIVFASVFAFLYAFFLVLGIQYYSYYIIAAYLLNWIKLNQTEQQQKMCVVVMNYWLWVVTHELLAWTYNFKMLKEMN
jgi:hypothetical protein